MVDGLPDLISLYTPEEEWQQLLAEWDTVRSSPRTRQLVLAGVPRSVQAALFYTAFVLRGDEDEGSYEHAAVAAASLRERLQWDWDGSLRRSQPRTNLSQKCPTRRRPP